MRRYSQHLGLAKNLGRQLHEVMGWVGPMTHRQFVVWQLWLSEQWNEPDRSDYYMMQIAHIVASIVSKKKVKFEQFRLKFRSGVGRKVRTDARTSKAIWLSAFGGARGIRGLPEDWVETELPKKVELNQNE